MALLLGLGVMKKQIDSHEPICLKQSKKDIIMGNPVGKYSEYFKFTIILMRLFLFPCVFSTGLVISTVCLTGVCMGEVLSPVRISQQSRHKGYR